MMLSDVDIKAAINRGDIYVSPFIVGNIQPASIDLTLESSLIMDPSTEHPISISLKEGPYEFFSDEFILGSTAEVIHLGDQYAAQVNGKSSLGRLGLQIHSTAGFVDPGFHGQLTLEMSNLSRSPIHLAAGMKICQVHFFKLSSRCARPYGSEGLGSHYQDQKGPTESRMESREEENAHRRGISIRNRVDKDQP